MFTALLNLFFPKVCYGCNGLLHDNELYACTACRHNFPITNFHLNKDNTLLKVFYGRVPIESATALLRFEKKGITQNLIHNLKYKGYEDIGIFLGSWLGAELKNLPEYENIDMIVPVPLHKNKLRKRGYNQVTKFGQELAKSLEAEYVDDVLIKVTNTSSQVTKSRLTRWLSNVEVFKVINAEKTQHKHILLVDDIITTGATLEACAAVLIKNSDVKISIATMSIA
ncbi:ComF family protein [Bizionia argentinensis JUB59]|uniref:ComF family protein n=1 Tax=Bizionia argentinensis JUB59 TaxID=1046627 RepID=G2EHA1_9FLAO|nr:phosphoribosyltransferase family protein [Bizionia argentinensis]EGV42292.1 ComF family protein [Bizionia argentinensis JUB59]